MNLPTFLVSQIVDRYVQENFKRLQSFFTSHDNILAFRGYELTFTKTESHYKFKHNLGYLPKDAILTSSSGSGTATFNPSLATATDLDITISGTVTKDAPLTIRFLAGTLDTGI